MPVTTPWTEAMTERLPGYSIIIPAYKSEKFITECLDSIVKQTHFKQNDNYEILLGIDACQSTLKKVKEIKDSYDKLKVYYFKRNAGPYVTKNSLIPVAKYQYLLFFDSDDHMQENMMSVVNAKMQNGYDVCRFQYINYPDDMSPKDGTVSNRVADGVVCNNIKVHDTLGGFEPWVCGADSDFMYRSNNVFNVAKVVEPLFFRRLHPNSLTGNRSTGANSSIRRTYQLRIHERRKQGCYSNGKAQKVKININQYEEVV